MNTDITTRKRMETDERLCAEVSFILASTIDYQETLVRMAKLVVRDLADCCVVEVVEDDGQVRREVVVHKEPSMTPAVDAVRRFPIDLRRPHLTSSVLETKQPLFITDVTTEYLSSIAQGEEHLRALKALDAKSLIVVPLIAHGRMLGALVLVRTSSSDRYQPEDLSLVMEVGARAALAVHNARLYRAAQRATKARDEVLGVVAHDLRNPLSTIMIASGRSRRDPPEPERRDQRAVEAIQRAANRMNRLVQDLLDVTQMEAGRLLVARKEIPAEQIVREAIDLEGPVVSHAGLELKLDVARDLPTVSIDRDRILQVFENLIGNAAKFTPSGGRVTVGANPRDTEILFWVENTGPAIVADELPHLFDRFWQAKKSERRGAGLGLPIVKGIIEAHGGRVWVESTEGRGTTFYFTIPLIVGAEDSRAGLLH
jgi:signal transduction histidine kinase